MFKKMIFKSLTQVLHKVMMIDFSLIIKGFRGRG
jgi:hypothetical protein